jgi:hypothetical protein
VSDAPEQQPQPAPQQSEAEHVSTLQPLPNQSPGFSKASIISLLALVGLLLLLFSSLFISSLLQLATGQAKQNSGVATIQHPATSTPALTPTPTGNQNLNLTAAPPLFLPNNTVQPPLNIPGDHFVIYESKNNLYVVSTATGQVQLIHTSGYVYNEAVRPILTPSGQILYSGNGLWLTNIFNGTPTRIADLAPNQVITSMALSSDGTTIAWSTEPADGNGIIDIYAGQIGTTQLVYEQQATDCPCFRVFSFMNGVGKNGDATLLLTDDRGSHEAVQYGLWTLDLTAIAATPQLLLDEDPQQGPLLLTPSGNTLLYSSSEGLAPIPSDQSVPTDVASLTYANSLDLATLGGKPLTMSNTQVVLPAQHNLNNIADYHWVTTPLFTLDGRTLVYVEFSSDAQAPYDRHSAIYTVQLTGSGSHLHASTPALLATSTARLIELGAWINNSILTFYSDGILYAMDIKSGAVTALAQTQGYARIVAAQ